MLVLLLAAGALAVVLSRGTYETFPEEQLTGAGAQARAPAWTVPCQRGPRANEQPLCAHVSGRVVWIQKHDPDGDGDRHLIVVSRLRPRIVKLARVLPVDRLPRIGARIDAVGWLSVGASGHTELDALRYVAGGRTALHP